MELRFSTCFRTRIIGGLMPFLLLAGQMAYGQIIGRDDTSAETSDNFGGAVARGDFNGDGFQDLAIGVPFESMRTGLFGPQIANVGAVEVVYGSSTGLASPNRQFWRQGGVLFGAPEAGDNFGASLAAGDFNGDGYDDLAIGVPGERVNIVGGSGSVSRAGAVNVIFGSASGLATSTFQGQYYRLPATDNVGFGWADPGDEFGRTLATGDFNRDGYSDLAIGVPAEIGGAGAVYVIYGSATGLTLLNPGKGWTQTALAPSRSFSDARSESGDNFGTSLSTGDFNGDGYADLAIGANREDLAFPDAGAVSVVYGSSAGLSKTVLPQFWFKGSAGLNGPVAASDFFGSSLASGDFNSDGYSDLAIGVIGQLVGSAGAAGAVSVIYGSGQGLSATIIPDQVWHQNAIGVLDVAEASDFFGTSLASGDFNGDGYADLAIGVPFEGVGSASDAGAVNVIFGSGAGLSTIELMADQFWHQNSTNVENAAAAGDHFGASLAAGDFNRDGYADLAIGVPSENLNAASGVITDAGAVSVLHGTFLLLTATSIPDQFWTQRYLLPPVQ